MLVPILVLGAGVAVWPPMPTPRVQPPGCYRFDRPLGSSASGELERGDSSWYRVELRDSGAVARPALASSYWRAQYAERSFWREHADSLFVRVSTGLVGWDLTLTVHGDGYQGTARYLTDARGGPPVIVGIHGVREAWSRGPPA